MILYYFIIILFYYYIIKLELCDCISSIYDATKPSILVTCSTFQPWLMMKFDDLHTLGTDGIV
ncbi:MAG: hypothetical protein ACI90V_013410 [Bacillariaceae sp.]|jgi:hypothetical protein